MRSSISSSSIRVAAFVAILVAAAALSEVYCRYSKHFSDFSFYYVKFLTTVDAPQSVLGDSQVGLAQQMLDYTFLGQPGQQPAELLLLVHYLYDRSPPRRVILQASQQWFGWYHWDRRPLLTAGAIPPNLLGFHPLILSQVYSRALADSLVEDGMAAAGEIIGRAHAAVPRPSAQEVGQAAAEWEAAVSGLDTRFHWSNFSSDKRQLLTTSRVYDQNPVEHFETSEAERAYRSAIEFLIERGAQVCLFHTPVTADYLATEKQIEDGRYEEFDRYIEGVAKSLSVRLVDFRQLPFEFDDSKFYNQDHMNDQAASVVWPLVAKSCFGTE
jgi:hypothetical protein